MPEEKKNLDAQLVKLPLFSKLKPLIQTKLVEGAQFRVCESGTVLIRQGEYTSDFFVLLEGLATSYRTETSTGKTDNLGTYGAGDWFGEMPALSNQPQFSTVKAENRCVLLALDAATFKTMYKGGGNFTEMIDGRYRERALAAHLKSAPLFKNVNIETLRAIAKSCELVTFKEDDVIAETGKEADAVYLVRSGVVKKISKTLLGLEQVQAYLCDNSSFGEYALADDKKWPFSFVAMTRVDLVKVGKNVFDQLKQKDKDTGLSLQNTAIRLAREEQGVLQASKLQSPDAMSGQIVELMVGKQAVKGGEALVIDLKRCTRCNACVESCVAVHEDRVPRLSKRGIQAGELRLTSACYNCKVPECMLACNYGAIRRDINGSIQFVFDNCTGCTACELKCPYGVIRMTSMADTEALEKETASFFAKLPVIGKFFQKPGPAPAAEPAPAVATPAPAPKKEEKKAIKCDLCNSLPFEACVYNCPCNAIYRLSPEELVTSGLFK